MINPINHYAFTNPASVYDEEALTALELAGRTANKVNECVEAINKQDKKIDNLATVAIKKYVYDWLDEHPEATTTVQDGSLTLGKFMPGELAFVSVRQFGAVGDGETDDTDAIRATLEVANTTGAVVEFEAGKTYLLKTAESIPVKTSINFNGCTIKLHPDCNTDFLFDVEGINETPVDLAHAAFTRDRVNVSTLWGKSFTMYSPIHMGYCGNDTTLNPDYYNQTMIVDDYGEFVGGGIDAEIVEGTYAIRCIQSLYVTPLSIENVHFDLTGVNPGQKVIICTRNNVTFDSISFSGKFTGTGYKNELIQCSNCVNIEFARIRCTHPLLATMSGYVFGLYDLNSVYIHDCTVGGGNSSWGAIGGSSYSNLIVERTIINRVDCHRLYHGNNAIRDCHITELAISGGYGTFLIENTTLSRPDKYAFELRSDYNYFFDGEIVFRNCVFTAPKGALFRFARTSTPTYNERECGFNSLTFVFDGCKVISPDFTVFGSVALCDTWAKRLHVIVRDMECPAKIVIYPTESPMGDIIIENCVTPMLGANNCGHIKFINNRTGGFIVYGNTDSGFISGNFITGEGMPEVGCKIPTSPTICTNNIIIADIPLNRDYSNHPSVKANNLVDAATNTNAATWNS